MYAYIIGKITQKLENSIILESNNIGFEIFVSNLCFNNLEEVDGEIKIFTYYQQKDDGVCLYGFSGQEEKNMFLKLITVSGIGPKGAMSILSNISPGHLNAVISNQDITTLQSVKGVGKKTAERILVELKDKIDIFDDKAVGKTQTNQEIFDACEVLCSLGLNKNEALKVSQSCFKAGDSAENIISKSLSQIRK